jgi:uncharacterized membrane protein YedE/YeeE
MDLFVLSGLGVGLVFGYALQRGRFCMNSAARDGLLLRDFTMLKAVGVAILVEMIGFAILEMTGLQAITPKPFFLAANLVGSFTFGVGMVLAGACASGLSYRTGEGLVSAMVAAVGLTAGALFAAGGGFLNPTVAALQANVAKVGEANMTLANLFGIPYYILALGIAIVAIVLWVWLGKPFSLETTAAKTKAAKGTSKGWGWMATGLIIGVIAVIAFPLSVASGRVGPIGITDGWMGIFKALFAGGTWSFAPLFIVGLIVGSFVAAILNKEFKFRVPSIGMLTQVLIGGLLMGFGAVCSGGCNITHILGGLPMLAVSSIVATIAVLAGAWLTAYLIFNVFRKSPAA